MTFDVSLLLHLVTALLLSRGRLHLLCFFVVTANEPSGLELTVTSARHDCLLSRTWHTFRAEAQALICETAAAVSILGQRLPLSFSPQIVERSTQLYLQQLIDWYT